MRSFADIHCHPTLKPYGHSFPEKQNNKNPRQKSSAWFYDPPGLLEKALDLIGGIVKYRQSDFSAMGFGNTGIVCASLYPIERGFFNGKLGTGDVTDVILNFATSVGKQRIDFVQSVTDYFPDLESEYKFLQELDGTVVRLADRDAYQYVIAKNFAHLESIVNQDVTDNKKANVIAVVVTIEGAHVFGCGIDPVNRPADPDYVLGNIEKVKSSWVHKPLFITVAHHFYNELCGHAESLSGIVKMAADQSYKMNTGFTELGKNVVRALLDNSSGKRILVDIKHMSRASRLEYFKLLDDEFKGEDIPVIVSHGAVMGNDKDRHFFLQADINFYDDEIIRVAKTNGLFGLQLDERRIAARGDFELKKSHGLERRKVLFHSATLVWRQIQHIAELLDSEGLFCWGIQSMGSDYDGVINPINGYWTAENYPTLADYLLMQAHTYMNGDGKNLTQPFNKIDAEEIVSRVMGDNAYNFMSKYFR